MLSLRKIALAKDVNGIRQTQEVACFALAGTTSQDEVYESADDYCSPRGSCTIVCVSLQERRRTANATIPSVRYFHPENWSLLSILSAAHQLLILYTLCDVTRTDGVKQISTTLYLQYE